MPGAAPLVKPRGDSRGDAALRDVSTQLKEHALDETEEST
jgi:hypothetical protein